MYATGDYLDKQGTPQKIEDICNHTIVAYGETAAPEIRDINWLLDIVKRVSQPGSKGRILRINNVTGILQATEAGLGLGAVPGYVASERPHLVRVFPAIPGPTFESHLVHADVPPPFKRGASFA